MRAPGKPTWLASASFVDQGTPWRPSSLSTGVAREMSSTWRINEAVSDHPCRPRDDTPRTRHGRLAGRPGATGLELDMDDLEGPASKTPRRCVRNWTTALNPIQMDGGFRTMLRHVLRRLKFSSPQPCQPRSQRLHHRGLPRFSCRFKLAVWPHRAPFHRCKQRSGKRGRSPRLSRSRNLRRRSGRGCPGVHGQHRRARSTRGRASCSISGSG